MFNRFPELSRTSGLFLGLSSPGKCHNKSPGLSRFSRTHTNPVVIAALPNSSRNSCSKHLLWVYPRIYMAGTLFVFMHLWQCLDLLGTVVMQYDLFQLKAFHSPNLNISLVIVFCIHETKDIVCSWLLSGVNRFSSRRPHWENRRQSTFRLPKVWTS